MCAAPPYLPKLTEVKEDATYTLILDLDETLVHYFEVQDSYSRIVGKRRKIPYSARDRSVPKRNVKVLRNRDFHCGHPRLC